MIDIPGIPHVTPLRGTPYYTSTLERFIVTALEHCISIMLRRPDVCLLRGIWRCQVRHVLMCSASIGLYPSATVSDGNEFSGSAQWFEQTQLIIGIFTVESCFKHL